MESKCIILSLIVSLFLLVGLAGCNNVSKTEFNNMRVEREALLQENKVIKQELEDLKFGPKILLDKAKINMDGGSYRIAKDDLETLILKHPSSSQAIEAKSLIDQIDIEIKKIDLAEIKEKEDLEKANKQRLENAVKKLRKTSDEISGYVRYEDKSSPRYVNYNGFFASIMQSQSGGMPMLGLHIQYAADDWLFIESYTIKVDGVTFVLKEVDYGEIKTDSGNGGIWEWLSRLVGKEEYSILRAVAKAKKAVIRFNGKDYYKDRAISPQQIDAINNVLDAYEALGGTPIY